MYQGEMEYFLIKLPQNEFESELNCSIIIKNRRSSVAMGDSFSVILEMIISVHCKLGKVYFFKVIFSFHTNRNMN